MKAKLPKIDPTMPICEFGHDWLKGGEYPDYMFEIEEPLMRDLKRTLENLAQYAAKDSQIVFLNGPEEAMLTDEQIKDDVDNLLWFRELFGPSHDAHTRIYEYGRNAALELAATMFINRCLNKEKIEDHDWKTNAKDIRAVIKILNLEGQLKQATELARFTGALYCWVCDPHDPDSVKEGASGRTGHKVFQLMILRELICKLHDNKLPTMKALCSDLGSYSEKISRATKTMEIHDYLPWKRNGDPEIYKLKPMYKGYKPFGPNPHSSR